MFLKNQFKWKREKTYISHVQKLIRKDTNIQLFRLKLEQRYCKNLTKNHLNVFKITSLHVKEENKQNMYIIYYTYNYLLTNDFEFFPNLNIRRKHEYDFSVNGIKFQTQNTFYSISVRSFG